MSIPVKDSHIVDETRLEATVGCNSRAYTVPMDVKAELAKLRDELKQTKQERDLAKGKWIRSCRKHKATNEHQTFGVCSECADEMEAELAKLRGIVEKLPKTADGVILTFPLQQQYLYHPDDTGRIYVQVFWWSQENCWGICSGGWQRKLHECYSTREAAQKAYLEAHP